MGDDLVGVSSGDVEGMNFSPVTSGDLGDAMSGADPDGTFLTGTSFDIAVSYDFGDVGVLPLDLVLRIPRWIFPPVVSRP